MKGKQIKTIEHLLSFKNGVVWVKRWEKHMPVAFLQNWQARLLHRWVQEGQFYEYKTKQK